LDYINIIDTDIEVDIYNRFIEKEYYENLKKQVKKKMRKKN